MKNYWYHPVPLALAVLLGGCTRYAYYVSPMHGYNSTYRTIPLQSGGMRSAWYANANIGTGSTNNNLGDAVLNMQGNIYRTHQLGKYIQTFYGGGLSLGNYHVASFHDSTRISSVVDTAAINAKAGNHFFGAGGCDGGINFVLPFSKHGGEWRVLGIHASLQKEFGSYLAFRQALNPDKVNGVAKSSWLGSLGFSSELVAKTGWGSCGFKQELGMLLGNAYSDIYFGKPSSNERRSRYSYASSTLQFTIHAFTVYAQETFGTRLFSAQLGVNYRLGNRKRK